MPAVGRTGGSVRRTASREAGIAAVEVIATRRGRSRTKVLVSVATAPCPDCIAGTRTISTWATWAGITEQISWCRHCFNALCSRVELSAEERGVLDHARAAFRRRGRIRYFDCARHAVDYAFQTKEAE